MTARRFQMRVLARCQRGIAALEFALIFSVLLLVIYVIVTLGAVLYTQQVVSRSAEDGARAVSLLPTKPLANDSRIAGAVYDSLAGSLIVPIANSGNPRGWIADNVVVEVLPFDDGAGNLRATVVVTYHYSANRLLPLLPTLGNGLLVPNDLIGRATAARLSEGPSA